MIKFLLLLSLSFNIAHAAIIAVADDCTECPNNALYDYVYETNDVTDSDDLCTMHHFFHFTAIIDVSNINFDAFAYSEHPTQKSTVYSPPSKETSTKPPIV